MGMMDIGSGNVLRGMWLALDTATDAMTIAMFKDGELIGGSSSPSERNHSNRLLPAIQELTAELGIPMRALSGIVVGQGPGSYTGIRIGVTVAKTLAWSLRIPLIAISSLEAMAYGVVAMSKTGESTATFAKSDKATATSGNSVATSEMVGVIPLIDARRGRAYTAFYKQNGDAWTCDVPDGIKSMEHFLDEIKGGGSGYSVIITGDVGAFLPLINSFRESWDGEVILDERPLQASSVGELALRYGMSRMVTDVHRFMPNYTQLSEPEKNYPMKTL